ncbi:MAG: hypothetical protein KGM99_02910 [Burkholderiales bacterium]|nr:hypothetical protein [Burkholderiales bacterium]
MSSETHISNAAPPLLSMQFSTLLNNGISACQEMGGDIWTDYNEHDPGVTCLEQLCYALTDLGYLLEFNVADVLAECPQQLKEGNTSLYTGNRILTCNPLTAHDYRKLILDFMRFDREGANRNFKNVWLQVLRDDTGKSSGLYQIQVEVYQTGDGYDSGNIALLSDVMSIYQQHRNLAEDAAMPVLLEILEVTVKAQLQIEPLADPNQVMADVLYAIQESFSHTPQVQTVDQLIQKGVPLDQIFDGPLLKNGVVDNAELQALPTMITAQNLADIILATPGVLAIDSLGLSLSDGIPCSSIVIPPCNVARLQPDIYQKPGSADCYPFTLIRNGYTCAYDALLVSQKLMQRVIDEEKAMAYARITMEREDYCQLAPGSRRDVAQYFSIQRQFPLTYGIGEYGVAQFGTTTELEGDLLMRRQAQAKQLKAYLLFFEQLLTNALKQYQQAGTLLSLDANLHQSYFSQSLVGAATAEIGPPDIEELFRGPQVQPASSSIFLVYLKDQIAPHEVLLRSRETSSAGAVQAIRANMIQSGQSDEHFSIRALPNAEYQILLHAEGDRQVIAFGAQRFNSRTAARAQIEQICTCLKNATAEELARWVNIQERGKLGLRLVNENLVLLAAYGMNKPQQDQCLTQLIRFGVHPDNYRIENESRGGYRLTLCDRHRQEFMRGEEVFASEDDAALAVTSLIALIQSLCCNADLQAKHIQRWPDTGSGGGISPVDYYEQQLTRLVADFDPYTQRRNQFLDHLLARFSEAFYDSELETFDRRFSRHPDQFQKDLIRNKIDFLKNYVYPLNDEDSPICAGAGRSQGAYFDTVDVYREPGLALRLRKLLCIPDSPVPQTDDADQHYAGEELFVLEHILLRTSDDAESKISTGTSYRVSVVFPGYPLRFSNPEFRNFAHDVVAQNCPAHLTCTCSWINQADMAQFKSLFQQWTRCKAAGHSDKLNQLSSELSMFLQQVAV